MIQDNKKDEVFPTVLMKDGKMIMSQVKLANTLANHFDEKVGKVREEVKGDEDKALDILEKLCKRRDEAFNFKTITEEKMYEIISKAPASKTVADDGISMDAIKQIPALMTTVMTKIFNKMIEQSKFPESLKLARVLPLKNLVNVR